MVNRFQSINQSVWKIVEGDVGIKKNLLRGVINVRALAEYLIDSYHLKASIDSVISALRRYSSDETVVGKDNNILSLFKNATIKTRNNVLCLTLSIDAPILEWYSIKHPEQRHTRVITGENVTKIFLHNSLIDLAKKHFNKRYILNENADLSELSFSLDEKSVRTKGVLARITGEIALNDINIEEIIVCPPEYVVYVKTNDLLKAHQTIYSIGK